MITKTTLKPTLWRTYRTLANADRLRLFKAVVEHSGVFCVSEYAQLLNLPEDVASVYLRQLNSRGLLGVTRTDVRVIYNLQQDRSLPGSVELQTALKKFTSGKLKIGWAEELARIFKGFTHFKRLAMIARLLQGPATMIELNQAAGMSDLSGYHHLRFLAAAGLITARRVWHKPDVYSLIPPKHPLTKLLFKQISDNTTAPGVTHVHVTTNANRP